MSPEASARRHTAILCTDMVGFMARMDEDQSRGLEVRTRIVEALRAVLGEHGGELLAVVGDGTVSTLPGAREAVDCALALQARLRDAPDLVVRIGIHVTQRPARDLEDPEVRLAHQMTASATGRGIRLSAAAFAQLEATDDLNVIDRGTVPLRGSDETLHVYDVPTGLEQDSRPATAPPAEHRLAAILEADVVSYSRLMATHENETVEAIKVCRGLFLLAVRDLGGRVIDTSGDGVLAEFGSALAATRCAIIVQESLRERSRESPPERAVRYRIGIHLGDIRIDGDRVYGSGVNIASRLEALAPPGGICISGAVHEQVRYQLDLDFEDIGEPPLKNIPYPVHAYAVRIDRSVAEPRQRARWRTRAAAGLLAALGLAAVAWLTWQWMPGALAPAAPIRSLAVLPLENLSGDPEQEYFADGMTEALIANLAQIDSLRVTSRTTVMQYRGSTRSLPEIAEELGVDAIVEGSVFRDGARVLITAQLIDARRDEHLWAEQFDRDLDSVIGLQREIASSVAQRIQARMTPRVAERLEDHSAFAADAQEAYMKGWYFAQKHTPPAALRARDHFEDSIRIAPDYPLGYAGLADMLSCSPMHTWVVAAEGADVFPVAVMDRAEELATRAIELDPDLPEAQTALGLVRVFREWDWEAAMASLDSAVEINPSFEFARRARALTLASLGRLEEAQIDIDVALEVDPLNAMVAHTAGDIHRWRGEMEPAVALYREAIELDTGNPLGRSSLGMWQCRSGETEAGLAQLREARAISQNDPLVVADIGYCHAVSGRRDDARALLAELQLRSTTEWVSAVALARIHVALGDHDAALSELERAVEQRAYRLVEIGLDDRWDPIRGDPRFRTIVGRVGVVEPTRGAI